MARVGRPTKLSPEKQKQLADALSIGLPVQFAAALIGINRDTFYEWMSRGARAVDEVGEDGTIGKEDRQYVEFSDTIKKAIAQEILSELAVISRAATGTPAQAPVYDKEGNLVMAGSPGSPGQWQAAAWKLERLQPDVFARRYFREDGDSPNVAESLEEFVKQLQITDERAAEDKREAEQIMKEIGVSDVSGGDGDGDGNGDGRGGDGSGK